MLPTSLNQITLQTYARVDQILSDKDLDTMQKDTRLLALLCGKTEQDILALTLKERSRILQQLSFLNEVLGPTLPSSRDRLPERGIGIYKLLTKKQPSTFNYKPLTVKGQRFGVIANANHLTGGQYIDLMNFLKDPDALVQNIHNVLAVIATHLRFGLFKTPYKGSEHARIARLFYEHLTVGEALPVLVFFCRLSRRLSPAIAACLRQEAHKRLQGLQTGINSMMPASVGSPSSTPSATAMAGHGSFTWK